MKASQASILMLLISALASSTDGLAANEGEAEKIQLLHGTWKVLQCLKFDTPDSCEEDANHLLVDDMVRVIPLFGNVGIVAVTSIRTGEIWLFSGYNLRTEMRDIDLQVTEGSAETESLAYLQTDFWDEGRDSSLAKEKRLELYLIKGGDATGQQAVCRAALDKLSEGNLSGDPENDRKVCGPGGGARVFWSICTIERSEDSCQRKKGEVNSLSPPDDGMGTGGSGDTLP